MKADELREALYTCLPEYTRLADDEIKTLARTIVSELGITREMVKRIYDGDYRIDLVVPIADMCIALTALLDLAEGDT